MTAVRRRIGRFRPDLRGGIRWQRAVAIAVSIVILGFGLAIATVVWRQAGSDAGQDFRTYIAFGERFLTTGNYYHDRQLDGPYEFGPMLDVLYPPPALAVFIPLAVLPLPIAALAWWSLPIAALLYQVRWMKPAPWAWPILAFCLAWPRTSGALIFGNSDPWVAAALAVGTIWGWPAVLVILKPSFAPLALIGADHRSWWIAMAAAGIASLLLIPMWREYFAVVNDNSIDPFYSFGALPIALIPVVARLARSGEHHG